MKLEERKTTRQLSSKSLRQQLARIAEFHTQRNTKMNRIYFNPFEDPEDEPPYELMGQVFVLAVIFSIVLLAYFASLQGTGF